VLFNAGCNEQVFFPKPRKKNLARIRLVVFEKNAKNLHFNSEKLRHWVEGYATLITSQEAVSRLKNSFRLSKNHGFRLQKPETDFNLTQ